MATIKVILEKSMALKSKVLHAGEVVEVDSAYISIVVDNHRRICGGRDPQIIQGDVIGVNAEPPVEAEVETEVETGKTGEDTEPEVQDAEKSEESEETDEESEETNEEASPTETSNGAPKVRRRRTGH